MRQRLHIRYMFPSCTVHLAELQHIVVTDVQQLLPFCLGVSSGIKCNPCIKHLAEGLEVQQLYNGYIIEI